MIQDSNNKETKMVDHLFRHQYGKMVSVLTRIFGLEYLEIIEDAVQDTFIQAMLTWRSQIPDKPEAWLMQAAKNRILDLFRKLSAEKKRVPNFDSGPSVIALNELFLDDEIDDSQLRMIFAACNPALNPKDQIAFALKTISGFSRKEIASALLLKEDTIKKRLTRARKNIQSQAIAFEIPQGKELPLRLNRVLEVLYLIFNEGFHSNNKTTLIREELCGEALRLCKMLLKKKDTAQASSYALFALMCFQAARLKSKVNHLNELLSLEEQDRSLWYQPLIFVGNQAMNKAVEDDEFSPYHFEAAIVAEHLKAPSFEATNWTNILMWYQKLHDIQPSPFTLLNIAIVHLQQKNFVATQEVLKTIDPTVLEQRSYLYQGTWAEYYQKKGDFKAALKRIKQALDLVRNDHERQFFLKKKNILELELKGHHKGDL